MKALIAFLVPAACLLIAGGATAQIDPAPDGIGIYADLGGLVNSIEAEPGEAIEVYLLATRTQHGMLGAEFKITPPPNATTWGFGCPQLAGGLIFLSDGGIELALAGDPLPAAAAVHVLTFIIRMSDAEAGFFYVGATILDSGGFNSPVYIDEEFQMHPLHPYPGGEGPSFSVNAGRTPVEPATWGAVKGLFQD